MLRLTSFCLSSELACRRNFSVGNFPRHAETHYEILKLRRDCNAQEIRNAYVKLSKKYHPDVKGITSNAEYTARFVKISEAYQTLIKPSARKEYDRQLWMGPYTRTPVEEAPITQSEMHRPWEIKPDYNPKPGPYYGFQGLGKVSNIKVALVLVAFGIFTAILGFVAVRHSFKLNREKLDEISAEANSHYANVVANAKKFGNEEQLRRMLKRMGKTDS